MQQTEHLGNEAVELVVDTQEQATEGQMALREALDQIAATESSVDKYTRKQIKSLVGRAKKTREAKTLASLRQKSAAKAKKNKKSARKRVKAARRVNR